MATLPQIALQVKNLHFAYKPDNPVLKGISLALPEGSFTAIIGQNGSGKTTLAKQLNGLLRPTAGQVYLYNTDIQHCSISDLSGTVGYVFQNPDHQIFSPTTRQEIAFGLKNLRLSKQEVDLQTQDVLAAFHLNAYADLQPATLSYGLRRKISIAAVMATSPKVLILDEPTIGLDWRSTMELIGLLKQYCQQGNTILLITHDLRLIADHIPQCMLLHSGQLLAFGETRTIFQDVEILHQAHLALPQINQLARRLSSAGVRPDILTVEEFCDEYRKLALKRQVL